MPTLELEHAICAEFGVNFIAGIDEAGRGAIAGPVTAAAVILPLNQPKRLEKLRAVNDSKQVPAKRREELFDIIRENVIAYGIASSSVNQIDEFGILPATVMAMQAAVSALSPAAEYLLVDGRIRLKNLPLRQQAVIRGDSKILSIAAASILAKVSRDRYMIALDKEYPRYLFAQHKGYCTARHVAALSANGPCPAHRRTFAPIRETLF